MQPLKILNIALFALVITLILQIFISPQKTNIQPGIVSIITKEKSVTVPNIPQITIHNNSTDSVSFNPCTDLSISVNSKFVENISNAYGEKCSDVTINAGQSSNVDLTPLYRMYANNNSAGQHILTIKNNSFGEAGKSVYYELEKP